MLHKEYDAETLNKLHQEQVNILDKFVCICDKFNLTYFLIGGTMLGAVRHQGFIPWDDDIDVAMPRSDYNKFMEIAQEELGTDYYLDCFETNKDYYLPFAKIKKNNTLFDEELSHHLHNHKGIFIDIFAYENSDGDNFDLKIRAIMVRNIEEAIFYKKKMRKLKDIRRKVFILLLSVLSNYRLMKIQKYFLTKNKNNDSIYTIMLGSSYSYHKENVLREDILPVRKVMFEGKEYNGVNNPDSYLKHVYGNYMELPPIEQRINHMPLKIDFGDKE